MTLAPPAVDYTDKDFASLRTAMLPVVTVIGIEAAFLIGGLIVTETVFNIPGIARFLVEAIRWRDYPIVQNLVMFVAVIVVVVISSMPSRPCTISARPLLPRRARAPATSSSLPAS